MSDTIYSPAPAGLDFQVIQYFVTNPEEELTTLDIGEKFGLNPAHVHTRLAKALEAGALKRVANAEEELVYSLGKTPTTVKPNSGKHPSLHAGGAARIDQALAGKSSKKLTRRREPLVLPAFDQIKLEEGVPLPERGGGHVKTDWPALFNRMKPGTSCVLPVRARSTLGKAITDFAKAKLGELSLRVISETELRLWRTK